MGDVGKIVGKLNAEAAKIKTVEGCDDQVKEEVTIKGLAKMYARWSPKAMEGWAVDLEEKASKITGVFDEKNTFVISSTDKPPTSAEECARLKKPACCCHLLSKCVTCVGTVGKQDTWGWGKVGTHCFFLSPLLLVHYLEIVLSKIC